MGLRRTSELTAVVNEPREESGDPIRQTVYTTILKKRDRVVSFVIPENSGRDNQSGNQTSQQKKVRLIDVAQELKYLGDKQDGNK